MRNETAAVNAIRCQYEEKKRTKLDDLKALDRKVKKPAETFAYTFGTVGSLVLGTGMSLAMKAIGTSLSFAMPLGLAVGIVGLAMVGANYFLYEKILKKRKAKYSQEILAISNEILGE